jgi:quercetin 2,3-dioxygenase
LTFADEKPMDVAPHPDMVCRLSHGPPFPETVMSWNFVARTSEEITQARTDWQAHRRFGDVKA